VLQIIARRNECPRPDRGGVGPRGLEGAERGSRSGVKWPGIKLHKSRVTLVENNVYNNG